MSGPVGLFLMAQMLALLDSKATQCLPAQSAAKSHRPNPWDMTNLSKAERRGKSHWEIQNLRKIRYFQINYGAKSAEDLGEDLCLYCPLDASQKGVYASPGGNPVGCEGSDCKEAYQCYLDSLQNNKEILPK